MVDKAAQQGALNALLEEAEARDLAERVVLPESGWQDAARWVLG